MSDLKKAGYPYQKVSPNNIKIASFSFSVKPDNVYDRHVKMARLFMALIGCRLDGNICHQFVTVRKFSFLVSLPTGDLQDHKSQVH